MMSPDFFMPWELVNIKLKIGECSLIAQKEALSVCFFIMVTNTPLFRSNTLFMQKRVMKRFDA